jgi:hypothetical protein
LWSRGQFHLINEAHRGTAEEGGERDGGVETWNRKRRRRELVRYFFGPAVAGPSSVSDLT